MTTEHTTCLICDSAFSPLKGYEKNHLVKCNSCGFVFCERIPSAQELNDHYSDYSRNNFNSPITVKRYNQLLDAFEANRKTNNILDIGCGDAYFLDEAKKRGWNVFGTEFTDNAITICEKKGISMKKGGLDPTNYPQGFFDVVTSFEVIEHINNPQSEIRSIAQIIRSGGLFYFTTPNFNSLSRSILKGKWNVIEYPEHLSYYTSKTIDRLLGSHGFKKTKLETTGINISRIRESTGKSVGARNSNVEEELREKTENRILFKLLKKSINFGLNFLKKGDSLKGWYVRT